MDIYQTGVFAFSFYSNIEFALVMVLLQRKQDSAAYAVDVVHRVLTPILLLFGTIGVFEQNEAAQQAIFTAMGLFFVVGLVGSIVYLRWRLSGKVSGKRVDKEQRMMDGEKENQVLIGESNKIVQSRLAEGQ
jgi:hypothetical protein